MEINALITRLRDIAWDFPPEHSINRAADMLTVLQAENNKLKDELRRREAEIARLNEAREIANKKAREYEKRAGLVEQKRKRDMKRLTIRNSDGTVSQPTTTSIEALFYRLAAYEDTGLEPEEIKTMIDASMEKAIAEIKEFEGIPIDRLRELAEADKEGRCVVLPCKVGDIVFCLVPQWVIGSESNEKTVHKEHAIVRKKFNLAYMDYIEKSVFLTREAAEAALKEREQNE